MEILPVEEFNSIPGKGIEGIVEGKKLFVVSPGYLEEKGIDLKEEKIEEIEEQGKTVVFLLEGEKVLGALTLPIYPEGIQRSNLKTQKHGNKMSYAYRGQPLCCSLGSQRTGT